MLFTRFLGGLTARLGVVMLCAVFVTDSLNRFQTPQTAFPACSQVNPPGSLFSWSPDSEQLAIIIGYMGKYDIYLTDKAGDRLFQLTHAVEVMPAYRMLWSPDGGQIAFSGYTDHGLDIQTINANGTHLRNLTERQSSRLNYLSSWSLDGQRINFGSGQLGVADLYSMNLFGNDVQLVTDNTAATYYVGTSPDGTQFAFIVDDRGQRDLVALGTDGSRTEIVPNDRADNLQWSADGQKILFTAYTDGDSDIYVMDQNGGNIRNLTNNEANDISGRWLGSSGDIIFWSNRDGDNDIYVMDQDGNNVRNLTDDDLNEQTWTLSRDHSMLLVGVMKDNDRFAYDVMPVNGGERREIVSGIFKGLVAWSPDGTRIAVCVGDDIDQPGEIKIIEIEPH